MKVFSIITAIITGLLLLSDLLCGLWIKAGKATEASSVSFHTNLSIATVIFGVLSVVLLIIVAAKL